MAQLNDYLENEMINDGANGRGSRQSQEKSAIKGQFKTISHDYGGLEGKSKNRYG